MHEEHHHDHSHAHDAHSHHNQGHDGHDKHAGHDPKMFKHKFWISFILTIPTLLFSPMVQSWFGFSWVFPGSEYISAALGVIIFFYGGLVFLKSARTEIASRRPGMMTLISMAITVAFIYSLLVTLRLVSGMDFWWELATLVTIMLLGHWLEMASVQSAQGALRELAKLLPDEAELVHGEHHQKVPVTDLKVGDVVLVRPGASIPVDGVVVEGESKVNESMLTGESKPVSKAVDAKVIGGTLNTSGALTVRVEKIGSDTALAGIMKLVQDAQQSKSKTQILADKAAFLLTFVALGVALLTWIGWWIAGAEAGFILERVVTVLVVACPHALGLAIPLVTAISTTLAAKNGLLIRERAALETARTIDVVLFDKTGTLTKGEQGVVDILTTKSYMASDILRWAATAEQKSEHPIARAIMQKAKDEKVELYRAATFSALAGRGVLITAEGKQVHVGGPRLLEELNVRLSASMQTAVSEAGTDGKTVVYTIVDGRLAGAIVIADVIREESRQAVIDLQSMGKRVALLTGDSSGVAAWVANELGIEQYFAEVLPEHKASIVKQLQADGSKVAMVGDGVNDAPALTQADVGIAIGAGTDVAVESAGIVLASSDPTGVSKIMTLSRQTYRKMLQNLAWATGYNAIALPLAAGVTAAVGFVLSPAIGAVLMSLSTIVVAINAQLLRRLKF